jgi:hypothetical protein
MGCQSATEGIRGGEAVVRGQIAANLKTYSATNEGELL